MNKNELVQFLEVIREVYKNHYKNYTDEDKKNMARIWYGLIHGYDYTSMKKALENFIKSDTRGFPPTVGQILNQLPKKPVMNELEAWGIVRKAIADYRHYDDNRPLYDSLPSEIKEIFTMDMLKDYATTEDNMTVIQSNFMRSFKSRQEQNKQNNLLTDFKMKQIGE